MPTVLGTITGRSAGSRLAIYAGTVCLAVLAAGFYRTGESVGSSPRTGTVQIAGSETMRPAVTACAEDFMARNPQTDIVVTGGGSSDGVVALFHGLVDIGMSSRSLTAAERNHAASEGVELSVFELALDGIAVAVHPGNQITSLDLGQLQGVFSGKLRNWRELGGTDADILIFARAGGSGTAALFDERVLVDRPYAASVQRLPTNEAIVSAVAAQPGAIGYTGLGAVKGAGARVKVIALGENAQALPVSPTPAALQSKVYPLSRTLYLVALDKPQGTVKALIDFCAGSNGQALMARAGYASVQRATQ